MLWSSEVRRIAVLKQIEARDWYGDAVGALWQYDAIGFSGYFSQWLRMKCNSACAAELAREFMGITDDDQNYS